MHRSQKITSDLTLDVMRHFLSIGFMALLAVCGVTAQDTVPKELVPIQGTWVITSANDQDVAGQGMDVALVVVGDKYTQTTNGAVDERGTLKLDMSKKPATLDLTIVEGDDAGKLQLGIVEITGNTMRGKLSAPGSTTRPSNFELENDAFVFTAKKKV